MRLLFKIVFISCILINSVFGIDENDWKRDALEYKVKEFAENNYVMEYKFEQTNKTLIRKLVKKYDEKGKRVDKQEYRYGILHAEYIDKLDDTGNRFINTKYIPDIRRESITNRTVKSNKKIVTNTDEMSFYSKNRYMYDDNRNVIEWANYKHDGTLLSKYNYKYDKKGNIIEDTFNGINGVLKWKNIYKYDNKGQIIEKTVYKYESLYAKYTFEYDGFGNMTEEFRYEPDEESNIMKLIGISEYEYIYW